jgi:uncharacterized membrane protein YdjX (TVP38/TMEM64 family)
MRKYTKSIIVVSILLFFIFLSFVFKDDIIELIHNFDRVKEYVLGFGIFAPIAMIFLIVLQIVLAPIPGAPFVGAAGYIFGFLPGLVYSIIGMLIGGFLAFKIGDIYGKPFLRKVLSKENFDRFENYPNEKKLLFLFIIFILPISPSDIVVFLAGASGLRLVSFLVVLILGRLPSILISVGIGAGIASYNTTLVVLLIGMVTLIFIVFYFWRDKIDKKIRNRFGL